MAGAQGRIASCAQAAMPDARAADADPAKPGLPKIDMEIMSGRTVPVVVDPQVGFLDENGVAWAGSAGASRNGARVRRRARCNRWRKGFREGRISRGPDKLPHVAQRGLVDRRSRRARTRKRLSHGAPRQSPPCSLQLPRGGRPPNDTTARLAGRNLGPAAAPVGSQLRRCPVSGAGSGAAAPPQSPRRPDPSASPLRSC